MIDDRGGVELHVRLHGDQMFTAEAVAMGGAGRARVMLSEEGFDRLEPGDVLVCSYSSPTWNMVFAIVGAVVADTGGLLSHAAITAREYGLPCVVGAHHATRLIPDGATVTVDGGRGIVRIEH